MALRKIMHIADMHISNNAGDESLLQKEKYVEDLIESLKKIEDLDTLIIGGDIVDKGGSENAYESANEFIERIRDELNIKHILCVPGNHDVNRNLLMGISGDKSTKSDELWKYYDIKLKYYWQFAEKNKLNIYSHSGIVSYEILKNPNIILLGIDSTDRIGTKDGYGFINLKEIEEGFKKIFGKSREKYQDYIKIAIMHHRPIVYESNSQTIIENNGNEIGLYGTCDSENWEKAKKILLEYGIHYVWTGHVHGTQSGQIRPFDFPHDEINYSTVGSIGIDFSKELKARLTPEKDKDLLDKLEGLKCYGSLNGNHNAYNIWTISDGGLVREEQYKYIIDEGNRRWCLWNVKDFEEEIEDDSSVFGTEVMDVPVNNKEPENYEEKILDIVREQGLYKTGHYHWKNSARLNWIDTSYFFQHREMMFYIAKGFNELFEKEEKLKNVDCIIGLGIKGTILLSYIRFLFPKKKCTYIPENKKEYVRYEMVLFNENTEINSIAVLTDVVHSGNTVKTLANEVYKKTQKFQNINVVSIFDSTPDGRIATVAGQARFRLYPLAKLKVTDCPGGCENCEIYIRKLANVIEYKED